MTKRICIIPARGGSKRIPKKNIRPFFGKPMLVHSIDIAKESGLFSNIVVSTDDREIAKVAEQAGADVPFMRPANLADDFTGTTPVVEHAAAEIEQQGVEFEQVCCMYATAPFVLPKYLQQGADNLSKDGCLTSFSVTSFPFPVQRSLILRDKGVAPLYPDQIASRSQDLEEAYHDAGQFYWWTKHSLQARAGMFATSSYPVVLPRYRVQDIDTLEDWQTAEFLYSALSTRTQSNH
ncbi:pseudaminic acid cytidylyltransferase [Aliagarivorans marinus]|uniref:pseudaminic acid cytidylyltransferase n=1 Tax=Aliagarivorans marinus TaxID=561965 RepID=UPI00042384E8|nr:pseudaminic acid cytidylyltransferase [Aliagarivorans marinus]